MCCSHKECNLNVYYHDKCILHSEKHDKNVKDFWEQIQNDLRSKYKCNHGNRELDNFDVVYDSVVFPAFQKDYIYEFQDQQTVQVSNFYFSNYRIKDDGYCTKDLSEEEFTDKLIEKCHIKFHSCIFLEEGCFERYDFKESILFDHCCFKKEILLNDSLNAYIEFRNCDFNNKKLSFDNKIFQQPFKLFECQNIASISMKYTHFIDFASFSKSHFKRIELDEVHFGGMGIFIGTHFCEDVKFDYCVFDENVFLNEAVIYKTIDLKSAIFKKEINVLQIKNQNRNSLKALNIANRETSRIIKNSFEKQNNIIEANKFYALEMDKRRQELSFCGNISEWLIFYIHKLSSNNSQSWPLVLIWIFAISMLGVENNNPCSICNNITCIIHYFDRVGESFQAIFKFDSDEITFMKLLLKVVMGYLIYQFIVSIRQNTRRK